MIHKTISPKSGYVRVLFELPSCLWADRIYLVGDFNQWDKNATPMYQEHDGVWRATVDLQRGSRAEFRYLVDGQWHSDNHADGFAENNFGVSNSVVHASLPVATLLDSENLMLKQTSLEMMGTNPMRMEYNHRSSLDTASHVHHRRMVKPERLAA